MAQAAGRGSGRPCGRRLRPARGGPAQATDLFSLFLYRTGFKHAYISYAAALSWVLLILTTVLLVYFVRVTGVFRGKQEIAPEAAS